MVDSIEQRVLELVKQHAEGIEAKTGTSRELVYHQHAYEYCWDQWEDVEDTFYDCEERDKALAELLQIGKPAVPTLVKILTSEKGEYSDLFSDPIAGVLPALKELADEELSKSLIQPFLARIDKISEKPDQPYINQIQSIMLVWDAHPARELMPAIYAALTKKSKGEPVFGKYDGSYFSVLKQILSKMEPKEALLQIYRNLKEKKDGKYAFIGHNREPFYSIMEKSVTNESIPIICAALSEKDDQYVFGEQDRKAFLNILEKTGTQEAITGILIAAKQGANAKYESQGNYALAIEKLKQNIPQNGKILYKIYRTTEDLQIKEIASDILGWRKVIYWLNK